MGLARLVVVALAASAGTIPRIVTVSPIERVTVAPGGLAELHVRVTVTEGYHLEANPASKPNLVPTRLELKPASGIVVGAPRYPVAHPFPIPGAEPVASYDGTFEIVLPLSASASAPPRAHRLRGQLTYQACTSHSCLFPASVPIEIDVRVAAPAR